ncbi:MAG TPA: LysR family transcriptional regulator [Mobilitalea sp.]|nr:LysR family transcriptional regulator [Mobilitalea sp.]
MDLHYLEIFNTIAKYSSFKKASEALHISQPALSIQIKKLETQGDFKLFYKTGNRIYLTQDGNMLYEYTKKIFALIEEMESNIANRNNYCGGTINLGGSNTPGTYILPIVIGEMKKRYPTVTIKLHIANTSEITTLIENGTLDVAVNGGNCSYSSHVFSEKLFHDKLMVIASPMNPLCLKEKIEIEDLMEESFIVHEKASQLYTCFRLFIERFNIPENISMYLGSIDAIKHAIYANLGISIIPYHAVKTELEMGILKALKVEYDNCDYPYNLVYNRNKNISLTTQKFIEVLREICGELK